MQLVIVDTTRIQPYIFGSNRLRENVGASYLVALATGAWALAAIADLGKELGRRHNVRAAQAVALREQLDDTLSIKAGDLFAEVIQAGGGNASILFQEKPDAEQFIHNLSRRVLADAPGLQLISARAEFDWDNHLLTEQMDEMFAQRLDKEKHEHARSAPLLGQGVTVMCQSTGLPAVAETEKIGDDEISVYPASTEIHAKREAAKAANKHLEEDLFKKVLKGSYDFPLEIEKLGRSQGEHSYLAVTHADGDGMGRRIRELSRDCRVRGADGGCSQVNRQYVEKLRAFSQSVAEASHAALEATLDRLIGAINVEGEIAHRAAAASGGNAAVAPITLRLENYKYLLPFRPIVFGGDDVTFICDGRLGLGLATIYASEFAAQTKARPECEGPITARTGVAIVKSHYPFARAYSLAEALAKSAKEYRAEIRQRQKEWDGTCIDWHFALGGLSGHVEEIRRREYTAAGNNNRLHLRPLTLDDNPLEGGARAWPTVRRLLQAFQEEAWAGQRNKVKALRDALREGPDAVKQFRTQYNAMLPPIAAAAEFAASGWVAWNSSDARCGYFDAIEAADWFMPL